MTTDGPAPRRRDLRRAQASVVPGAGAPSLSSLFAGTAPSASADGDPTPTILVVCSGNICRSPLGELLLQHALAPLGVRVHSAGTTALVGHRMARESQRIARALGISADTASAHRARALTDAMVERADVTLTMTAEHRTAVIGRAPTALRRVFTVREFAALAETLPASGIPDAAAPARARLAETVGRIAARRGTVATGVDVDDVIDPYRGTPELYDLSARQLVPAVAATVRVVRAVLAPRV